MTGQASARPGAIALGELSLDRPLAPLAPTRGHRRARVLVRLHSRPIGEALLPVGDAPLSATRVAELVWGQLGAAINAHLIADGLPVASSLPIGGLAAPGRPRPPCLTARDGLPTPSTTVVIATRNRTESVLRCLESLAAVDYPAFDVVVVDSAPSDEDTRHTLAGGRGWPFPLRYVRTERPGLGYAHNTALPVVTGELVAFTDDDVQVDPLWLRAIAEGFADPAVMCVTGLILAAELDTPAQLWLEQSGGFARGYTERRYCAGDPPDDRLFPFTAGRFGSGANMAFRTGWLRAHGGFDRATGAGTPARGGDDLLLFLQVILDGAALCYQPAALLRHWHRRDYAGLRRQSFGYGVGLGAYLTAAICAQPELAPVMLRRAGPALRHLLDAESAKNHGRERGFPRELTRRERAGILVGPFAYAVSRWRYRGDAPAAYADVDG